MEGMPPRPAEPLPTIRHSSGKIVIPDVVASLQADVAELRAAVARLWERTANDAEVAELQKAVARLEGQE